MFRKATLQDIDRITEIYEAVHSQEEAGLLSTGWKRGIYPTRQTVIDAINRNDMFVESNKDIIVAAAIINQKQGPEYEHGNWQYAAAPEDVMVLHTLAVDPAHSGQGYAKRFVQYYEAYAKEQHCTHLRMDTQAINSIAKNLYLNLGYQEAGIVDCVFNGISGVHLLCLEKKL